MQPYISIVIPTRNRVNYLPQLFESILIQKYRYFNIIISDNSDNDGVEEFVNGYKDRLPIIYHRNRPPVSMAENWNVCFELATGKWVKMIHDDDWFTDETALQKYADATLGEGVGMVFCGHRLYNENTGATKDVLTNQKVVGEIQADPFLMFYNNVVGPPSTTMFRADVKETYDTRMTWVVDLDQYFRVINRFKVAYIAETLVTISHNESQVTNSCFRNRTIEIPEALMGYEKYGNKLVDNLTKYDGWWRLVRNLEIRQASDFTDNSKGYKVPQFVFNIINAQKVIPAGLLKNGLVSKSAMALHYFFKFKLSA